MNARVNYPQPRPFTGVVADWPPGLYTNDKGAHILVVGENTQIAYSVKNKVGIYIAGNGELSTIFEASSTYRPVTDVSVTITV